MTWVPPSASRTSSTTTLGRPVPTGVQVRGARRGPGDAADPVADAEVDPLPAAEDARPIARVDGERAQEGGSLSGQERHRGQVRERRAVVGGDVVGSAVEAAIDDVLD